MSLLLSTVTNQNPIFAGTTTANTNGSGIFIKSRYIVVGAYWSPWSSHSLGGWTYANRVICTTSGYFFTYHPTYTSSWRSTTGLGAWTANAATPAVMSNVSVNGDTILVVNAGVGQSTCYRSTDFGASWVTRDFPQMQAWGSVAYGNGRWMCVPAAGGTYTAYSDDDGVTWYSGGTLPSNGSGWSIVFFKDRFCAAPIGGNPCYKSFDGGITWSTMSNNSSSPTGVYGKLAAVGDALIRNNQAYNYRHYDVSFDGNGWSQGLSGLGPHGEIFAGGNLFIDMGYSTTPPTISLNGINWQPLPYLGEDMTLARNPITGRYLAVWNFGNVAYIDIDGPQPLYREIIE